MSRMLFDGANRKTGAEKVSFGSRLCENAAGPQLTRIWFLRSYLFDLSSLPC